MTRRGLGLLAALVPALALAQQMPADSPATKDIPDASVGVGGADLKSPESQDSVVATSCTYSNDCEHGFVCVHGACVYQRTRDATFEGCQAAPASSLWGLLALAWVRCARGPAWSSALFDSR